MVKNSIFDSFLAEQGYALFEHLGNGAFRPVGASSRWCEKIWGPAGGLGKALRLAEQSPFLENFLVDAESFWNSKRRGAVNSGVWIERGAGGRETPLEASALKLEGRPVLILRNISSSYAERQQLFQTARDSLLEHERLIREIQKKEILLHCIIHDLSQPLTAMRGCFNILSLEDLSSDLKRMVETGQRESHRQEQMIRGILEAFSGDLAAQQASSPDTAAGTPLAASAQRVVQEFSPAFSEKGIRLQLDQALDVSRDWNVTGDAPRLERVFGNLLENALRYSPKGSTVTVGVENQGPFLRAFVDDEGPGLSPGTSVDRLFALFSKGKDRPGKAGLGLYFCKITVERWGGKIGAETRKFGGSRFWFRLPRAATTSQSRPAKETPAAEKQRIVAEERRAAPVARLRVGKPARHLRILVAEDTDVNRELVFELLQKRGHSVVAVENGREALAALAKDRFDVVLMDEQMPEMDGLEATRAIRGMEASSGKHQIVIALTGNVTHEDNKRRIEAGMDGFLPKPFDMHALFQIVESPPHAARQPAPPETSPAPPELPSVGVAELLWRTTGGNEKLIQSLVKSFLADAPKKFSSIRRAIAQKDAAKLAATAHAMKGAIAIFGAQKAVVAARNLEAMGRAGNLRGTDAEFRALDEELQRLTRELLALQAESKRAAKLPVKPRRKR